jgi:hypothetical protein
LERGRWKINIVGTVRENVGETRREEGGNVWINEY